jgi:hypothetical protein
MKKVFFLVEFKKDNTVMFAKVQDKDVLRFTLDYEVLSIKSV